MAKFGFKPYRRQMEESLGDKLNQQLESELKASENMDDLFTFADYNAEDAERIGYSDYSYWAPPCGPSSRTRWLCFSCW